MLFLFFDVAGSCCFQVPSGERIFIKLFLMYLFFSLFFQRTYSTASFSVSRACSSRKYAPTDLGFRSAERRSGGPVHLSDC